MKNIGAMAPATVYLNHNFAKYKSIGRVWQGIPGIERTKDGRLFAIWYSGGYTEQPGNVIIAEYSDNDGKTWTEGFMLVLHDDPHVRCFDPAIWIDPKGRLWLFWTQSVDFYDGRNGVWAAIIEDPDARELTVQEPRRIANGLMLNKPTVLRNGEWVFPCTLWDHKVISPSQDHPELADERLANVYVSCDEGETFVRRGGVAVPGHGFDEHMIVEKEDGRLWMLVRAEYGIGQAFSSDGGYTWQDAGPSGHRGPNARFFIRRLKSGNLLMINHITPSYETNPKNWNERYNMMAMLSMDDGRTWHGGLMLDARTSVSYPDGVQAEDGLIYIIYDYDRFGAKDVLLATFTEEDVLVGRPVSGRTRFAQTVSHATGKLPTAEELWARFTEETGIEAEYDAWAFGDDSDALLNLVVRTDKTSTSSAYPLYALEGEELPKVGEYNIILDSKGFAGCITRTTKVYVVPFKDVTAEHARKEGEGDRSLAYWRKVHEDFFTREMAENGLAFTEDMPVVCEEFEVVYSI